MENCSGAVPFNQFVLFEWQISPPLSLSGLGTGTQLLFAYLPAFQYNKYIFYLFLLLQFGYLSQDTIIMVFHKVQELYVCLASSFQNSRSPLIETNLSLSLKNTQSKINYVNSFSLLSSPIMLLRNFGMSYFNH